VGALFVPAEARSKGQIVNGLLYVDPDFDDCTPPQHSGDAFCLCNALDANGSVHGINGAGQDQRQPALKN